MTSTLFILLLILFVVLLYAIRFALRQRSRSEVPEQPERPVIRKQIGSHALRGLTTEYRFGPDEDLLISSLLQSLQSDNTDGGNQCATCSRLYDERSKYCYIDGTKLGRNPVTLTEFWVCTLCGFEDADSHCSCLTGSQKVGTDRIDKLSIVPLARCEMCQGLGKVDSICELDHLKRTPVFDLNLSAFPPHGFGPRRTICLECGLQFSSSAKYCSADGRPLSTLN